MYAKDFLQNINHLSGDRLSILQNAMKSFTEKQAAQASAGLAYYTFFFHISSHARLYRRRKLFS